MNKQQLRDKIIEAVGWAYADCCVELDKGGDPREIDMGGVLPRMYKDLGLEEEFDIVKEK